MTLVTRTLMCPLCAQGLKAVFPPANGPGAVEIAPADLASLAPGVYVNDTIMDYYAQCVVAPPPVAPRLHGENGRSQEAGRVKRVSPA